MALDLEFIRAQYPVFSNPETARWAMFGDGMSSGDAVKKLVERDIVVRNGGFYALRCLEALGIQDPSEF